MQRTFSIPREVFLDEELTKPGMSSCQGCGAALAMKIALRGLGKRTVVVFPACCFTVFVGSYPYSSLGVPIVHCPFATAAITAAGIAAAMKRRGEEDTNVMAWAGDGGTFDIGLQSLSGAAERNEDILFVCYDNEAYMNTGIQRSSATPFGASTTTSPAGKISIGQTTWKKNMAAIAVAHDIPYVATACPSYPFDLIDKVSKAVSIQGPTYLHILSMCPTGWRYPTDLTIRMGRLAVETGVFPLYEVENGKYKLSMDFPKLRPVRDYLKPQGRFRHLPEEEMDRIQEGVNREYEKLKKKLEA